MNKIHILILFAFMSFSMYGQVIEQQESMSEGLQNAFVIDLKGADKKITEDVWKKYIGQYGKTKRDRKSKEWRSEAITIPAVDDSYQVNLFGKIEDLGGNSRLYVWLKMDSEFIDSERYTNESRGMKELLEDVALEVERASIRKEAEAEQKALNSLEKDLSKLIKKRDGYFKDIKQAEEAIIKAEKNIDQNAIDQEGKKISIEEQKAVIKKIEERLLSVGKDQ